jgi:hypothetical protein
MLSRSELYWYWYCSGFALVVWHLNQNQFCRFRNGDLTLTSKSELYFIYVDWLIDWLFIVLRPAQELFLYGDVTVTGEGLQNLGLRSALRAFEQEGSLSWATPAAIRGLGFSGLIRRTIPFSRLLRNTRRCGGPILTQILKCLSYTCIWVLCRFGLGHCIVVL